MARPALASSRWLFDFVFPRRCVSCGSTADLICLSCRRDLLRICPPQCHRCGAPTAWPVDRCRECAGRRIAFATARAAIAYRGAAVPLVRSWKEHGLRRLAGVAADLLAEVLARPAVDVITYIPPDDHRRRVRGYQPAEQLARELSLRWELDLQSLLERARPVRRQTGLSLEERRRNMRDSFVASAAPPRSVLVVDDVYTTGATTSAAARALRQGGARTVHVVTFARTIR